MRTDTIAAIATAMSDSGIGIIRVSGEDALMIVDKIYRNSRNERILTKYATHTIHYGFIIEETEVSENVIDEVMVTVMKAPRSYTAEDTVEINCHGGILMMRKILATVICAGARIAEPGEFTKRAFLNGRIDLSKAEAVMDIIHAKNEFALQSSVKQLKGSLSDKIINLRKDILYEIAFIESALDDPEHISLDGHHDRLSVKTDHIMKELNRLLDSADDGRMLREGINTVIVGKPNAGKSSLLNALVGRERAIVTDIAGTTRDVIEEQIHLGGFSLHLIDTAGIRDTKDLVEQIGVNLAKDYLEKADLVIYVADTSSPLNEDDYQIMDLLKGRKAIILLNKSDLNPVVFEEDIRKHLNQTILPVSAKNHMGIDLLEEEIKKLFFTGKISMNDEVFITNARHKTSLLEAKKSLEFVLQSIRDGMPEDFYSIDLMNVYEELGKIVGEAVEDDLVNEIFSKFCMGK